MSRPVSTPLGFFSAVWLVCCGAATPAFAQRLGQGGGVEIAWWRVAGALALCLALAVAGAFALRARMQAGRLPAPPSGVQAWSALAAALRAGGPSTSRSARRLQLVETLRLSHQVDVCLLECDGRNMIIATTPQGAFVVSQDERGTGATPS